LVVGCWLLVVGCWLLVKSIISSNHQKPIPKNYLN